MLEWTSLTQPGRKKRLTLGSPLTLFFPVPVAEVTHDKIPLGHNLYDDKYANDFSRLADSLLAGNQHTQSISTPKSHSQPTCPCAACSPLPPATHISHSSLDSHSFSPQATAACQEGYLPPLTRAYLHHLLNTHEMSAHALLVLHNLATLDAFFTGLRTVLVSDATQFPREIEKFNARYDEEMQVFERAKSMWKGVDQARGKGRLAREREKDAPAVTETLGNLVPVGEITLPADTIVDLEP